MLDLSGPALSAAEREALLAPAAGGVILFSRNHESREQITALAAEIHALRSPPLLVAVDHEGGRVQRFREGFTALPAPARLGEMFDLEPERALRLAETAGWVMAAELRAVGVDFSFAPVLDLGRGVSTVIGDRAFHRRPAVVAQLARAYVRGVQRAGMAAVGKHFPGHGGVAADSHDTLPVDPRPYAEIQAQDLVPFERLIHAGLAAVMPAHVVFPAVDSQPAGFSRRWLRAVLRERLGFQGAVVSDDLSMAGALVIPDPVARVRAALEAGCDLVLACRDPASRPAILAALADHRDPVANARLARLHGRGHLTWADLERGSEWRQAAASVSALERAPELALGDDATA